MAGWTDEELTLLDSTDELRLSSARSDGNLSNPTTMWMVRRGGDVFVRSVNGRSSHWFRGTQTIHSGRIEVGKFARDVEFVEADGGIADELDESYRRKYHRYAQSIVDHITSHDARQAALELVPR